jgi:FixJ family two-component response regulator
VDAALARSERELAVRDALRKDGEAFERLTPRERDVCVRIAQGMLNKQVGFDLGTSEKTVKAHRARVMQKLGAASLADVVRLVERLRSAGLLEDPAVQSATKRSA